MSSTDSQSLGTVIVVVGPTAAGKSGLAIQLAKALDGEVVSADSMQVYRQFDIGTGKVTARERDGIAHHLIDVVDPREAFSAARFVALADRAIQDIRGRGRVPVVAGGTGLYVRALLHGLFEAPPSDAGIRAAHAQIRRERGVEVLHAKLSELDPESAARINRNDFQRISRALEIYAQLGRPISQLQREHRFAPWRYAAIGFAIAPERDVLRQRIECRVDAMLQSGWLEEVRELVSRGLAGTAPMGALGYRQLCEVVAGQLDLDEAVRLTKRDTWRFARRQLNWFGLKPGGPRGVGTAPLADTSNMPPPTRVEGITDVDIDRLREQLSEPTAVPPWLPTGWCGEGRL